MNPAVLKIVIRFLVGAIFTSMGCWMTYGSPSLPGVMCLLLGFIFFVWACE